MKTQNGHTLEALPQVTLKSGTIKSCMYLFKKDKTYIKTIWYERNHIKFRTCHIYGTYTEKPIPGTIRRLYTEDGEETDGFLSVKGCTVKAK